jgi:hypothetical protein
VEAQRGGDEPLVAGEVLLVRRHVEQRGDDGGIARVVDEPQYVAERVERLAELRVVHPEPAVHDQAR